MAVTGFGEIAEKLRRSTVLIHAGGRGSGSGVIWSSDGIIITNAHVARGTQISLQLWDGHDFPATVASRDRTETSLSFASTRRTFHRLLSPTHRRSDQVNSPLPSEILWVSLVLSRPESFMRLVRFEVSVHNRGYRRMFAWRREIPAARLPTPVVV